jgi:acyl carrier protein
MNKSAVMQSLVDMITEVLGEEDLGIEPDTSFKDGLAFQSIQFIALAELIQERYDDVDFVSWLGEKEMPQILALRVGDVADFIVGASAG